jgi:hypothetical protein
MMMRQKISSRVAKRRGLGQWLARLRRARTPAARARATAAVPARWPGEAMPMRYGPRSRAS